MKKIFVFLLFISVFSSCDSTNEDVWVIEESIEIVSDYTDTLEWSITDAQSVVDTMNNTIEAQNELQ